ncbi:MAG: hypothetical protein ACRDL5_17190, partial [Solirubrobacteraceae bacterium]
MAVVETAVGGLSVRVRETLRLLVTQRSMGVPGGSVVAPSRALVARARATVAVPFASTVPISRST